MPDFLRNPKERYAAYQAELAQAADANAISAAIAAQHATDIGTFSPLPSGTPTAGQVPVVTTASPLALGWGSAGGSGSSQTFTASGSFTVPAGVTRILVACIQGGQGGGGGGSALTSGGVTAQAGGAGGNAGYVNQRVMVVAPGDVYTVTVGAGGTAGGGGAANGGTGTSGGVGGMSSFSGPGGTVYAYLPTPINNASAGNSGAASSSTSPYTGAAASYGAGAETPGAGGQSARAGNSPFPGGVARSGGGGGTASATLGGGGGGTSDGTGTGTDSPAGATAASGTANGLAGATGTVYGAGGGGGGGGAPGGTGGAGGAGAPGLVLVSW